MAMEKEKSSFHQKFAVWVIGAIMIYFFFKNVFF